MSVQVSDSNLVMVSVDAIQDAFVISKGSLFAIVDSQDLGHNQDEHYRGTEPHYGHKGSPAGHHFGLEHESLLLLVGYEEAQSWDTESEHDTGQGPHELEPGSYFLVKPRARGADQNNDESHGQVGFLCWFSDVEGLEYVFLDREEIDSIADHQTEEKH